MKIRRNIYSLSAILLLIGLIACQPPPNSGLERPAGETSDIDQRGFDPLELPRDKEIIPRKYPRTGDIEGSATLIAAKDDDDTDAALVINLPLPTDTIQSQVFRVQLLTSKAYSESRHAVSVAEEIFDQLVYLDYEVPYYKVRVGDFGSRELAVEYQMKAKAAGYPSCWVVVVNVGVKEAPMVYDDLVDAPVIDSAQTDEPDESEGNNDFR